MKTTIHVRVERLRPQVRRIPVVAGRIAQLVGGRRRSPFVPAEHVRESISAWERALAR